VGLVVKEIPKPREAAETQSADYADDADYSLNPVARIFKKPVKDFSRFGGKPIVLSRH
jgi:hypothetical protein